MAAPERRRSWSCAGLLLRGAPAAGPRARQQLKGIVLILLVCGQEVSARISSTRGASDGSLPQWPSEAEASDGSLPPESEADVEAWPEAMPEAVEPHPPSDLQPSGFSNGSQNGHSDVGVSTNPGYVTWGLAAVNAERRMTAVNTRFKVDVITTPPSNLKSEGPSSDVVWVHAGVLYRQFVILASSGLGTDAKKVRVKLVPFDFAATLQTCAQVTARMGKPFDGSVDQLGLDAEVIRNAFTNSDKGFAFPQAGEWRLCYTYNGVNWEELAPKIIVVGSERVSDKFWCALSLLKREECPNNPSLPGCECQGKVEGFKKDNRTSAAASVTLGLPNPAYPPWMVMMSFMHKKCGVQTTEPFLKTTSLVTNAEGYEIHNMGVKKPGTTYGVWKICYCVGFDQDNGVSTSGKVNTCYKNSVKDYAQSIGMLITVDIRTKKGSTDITVYPTLRFSLVLECGVNANGGTQNSPGGCSTTDVARYKIVEQKKENDFLYFDARSGCRFLPQVETTITGTKTLGGHLGPDNCINPVACNDKPEVLGPMLPSWNDVQVDASYENTVMVDKTYDVCYCDGNCLNSMFWFKAGSVTVKPVKVFFSDDGNRNIPPIVNTMYYLIMRGDPANAGGWTDTGSNTREMKILRDDDAIVDKVACLSQPQPNVVSGHRLVSGNTDYTDPSATVLNGASKPVGQRYGNVYVVANDPSSVAPNIKILESGWYAVCYCDSNCNEMLNWSVYGRTLVSGPLPGQQWMRFVGVTFDLDIKGWNLGVYNRLRILSTSNELGDCGTVGQSDRVFGPAKVAELRTKSTEGVLVTKMAYDVRGTEITFSKLHKLKDGDRLKLEGVNAPTTKQNEMYNRVHEIFVACDDPVLKCYKILIPIKFPAAEFPALRWDSVTWTRTSIERFKNMRITTASPEGRGYIACWSPEKLDAKDYVGQAGKIIVKDAIEMPEAALGLTTVMPDVPAGGGPVIIAWKTGDIASYAQTVGPMTVKIVFMSGRKGNLRTDPYIKGVEPRNYALQGLNINLEYDQLGEETQAVCGELFLEMWSEDPGGFPMPKGCYYTEDSVNSRQILKEMHIVFSPKNHLKKNTRYMIVMNAQVKPELKKDFPNEGAVFIWSMADAYLDPFRVIELGRGKPQPEDRVPPRDATGKLELNTGTDGLFDAQEGFRILGQNDPVFKNRIVELKMYCLAHDLMHVATTPTKEKMCKPCVREEDCGNGYYSPNSLEGGRMPDPSLTWCVSPLDILCPAAGGSSTKVPAFEFELKAKYGRPIKKLSILRIFMQPLTVWNLKGNCNAVMSKCLAPGGLGECNVPICKAESVVGGVVVGASSYPVNILKISLPSIMADITTTVKHRVAIGGLPLPKGGFLPQAITAELMKEGDKSPDYWDQNTIAKDGARLFKQIRVVSAAIVTHLGDGNSKPFKNDKGNVLYIRMIVGANLWAKVGDGITFQFLLPLGYKCDTPPEGVFVPPLGVVGAQVPSFQGKLGGNKAKESTWTKEVATIVSCTLNFREHMVYYAYSAVYIGIRLVNPVNAMKKNNPLNKWSLVVRQASDKITAPKYSLQPPVITKNRVKSVLPGYGGSVPTLGKLSNIIIAPSNFGLGMMSSLDVFFRTEQEVGSVLDTRTQIWVDGPSGFDFRRYCGAYKLPDTYYIPEPVEKTFKLPVGDLIECLGGTTTPKEITFNRAMVKTQGRLLKKTTYAFRLEVVNAKYYIRSQLNQWRVWTFLSSDGSGVDGSYETARFNEKVAVGADTSFGCYQKAMPSGALGVTIADLRPTMGKMQPTEITFLPIIVQLPMQKAVRILAPSGYIWDFLQTEFRYKAPGRGVPPSQAVPGAQQDLPISGVPARPIAEPRNKLAIDYMQAEWIPGIKYGFIAKIRVPPLPPTTASNFFSIEFGYDGLNERDRLEAGVVTAPLVRRIINGRVGSSTSIVARRAEIIFSMQLVTKIPRAGGLVIKGPPNFIFNKFCQPKPVGSYPELPYDSTCLFRQIPATGELEISIVAGPLGISPFFYRFSLMGTNPPQAVPLKNAGSWVFYSYQVLSEKSVLDYPTNVSGYSVNKPMYTAKVIAPPLVQNPPCYFLSLKQRIEFPTKEITNCAFEDWQFYPEGGGSRDDRPKKPSALIFQMQLATNAYTGEVIVVRGPEGYVFNTECKTVVNSPAVFNDTNIGGNLPKGFIQKYAVWPTGTLADNCYGQGNVARITVTCGQGICLTSPNKYIFRLSVLTNPKQTPSPNKFTLEYNGEASEPFEGVQIWAFTNTSIIPTTTAASLRHTQTVNNVTVYLRGTNDLPNGGHLRIEAPSGMIIKTKCRAFLQIHKDEAINISSIPAGPKRVEVMKYAEFMPKDYSCEGDVTMSSRSRIHFRGRGKFLKKGVLYEFTLEVTNPQTTTAYNDPWTFTAYKDSTPNHIIDTATVPGFPINAAAPAFAYMSPNSVNALARQLLEFNMSFPMDVVIGDMIEIVAPVTFYFSEPGDARCPDYQFLDGSMRKTQPICGANTMMWVLQEEMVPGGTAVRFLVRVKNPPRTPERNLFQVRQVSPTGKRKSSRMIPGYAIVPELSGVTVSQVPPLEPKGFCRSLVPVITFKNCSGASSYGSVFVKFTPMKPAALVQLRGHVKGVPFDFSKAFLPKREITINAREKGQITANLAVRPGTMAELLIEGIKAPAVAGTAEFTVTTYSGESPLSSNRIDEKLDLPSFEILQYINRISSRVNPIYYRAKDSTVSFELEPLMAIMKDDVFRITRPPGYMIKDQSFQGFRGLRFSEQGLDSDRKWSQSYENPEDYYVVFSKSIIAKTRILWTLTANLPPVQQKSVNWYFKTYRVLPQRDVDGEILDAKPVPYPWIGRDGNRRDMMATGTNDGAFTGFLLVGQVPFKVTPELKTPGAEIRLTINFKLPYTVQAKTEVKMEVTAPAGFMFRDSCFSLGSPIFRKCTGYRGTATLVSTVSQVSGSNVTIHLTITNPGTTPSKNVWTLAVFQDENTQYVNWSPGAGYEILPMAVVYRGNNQLAVTDTGFFDFTPLKRSTSEVLYVIVIPPKMQGYRLLCTGIQKLGFQGTPVCVSGPVNSQLKLKFNNGTLDAGVRYTLGVGILNPGGKPLPSENFWGILLQDHAEKTFDGNLRIQGDSLKSIPIRSGIMGWLVSTPKVMNTVSMQMRVLHKIPAAMITKIVIGAPYGVRFMEDKNAVKVTPIKLPLYEANPSEVANPADVPNSAGPLLMLNLDVTKDIAENMYNIRFECSNPGTTRWDNTWSLIVMKDIEVEYSHYNVGFEPGQISPYEIVGSGSGGGVASHAARRHHFHFAAFVLVGLIAGLFVSL